MDRKKHDNKHIAEEWRHRKADHGHKGANLIKHRILPVGRINADGERNQYADNMGHADNPQHLWQALNNDVHHWTAGLPTDHAQITFGKGGAKALVD